MEVGLCPDDIVLDGDPAPLSKKRGTAAPNFRPMYCDETAGWIKMPLGTEVGLGPGHIVFDGDPAPPKGRSISNCQPMSVVDKRSPISATAEHLSMAAFIKSYRVAQSVNGPFINYYQPHRATQKLEFTNAPCNRSECTERP